VVVPSSCRGSLHTWLARVMATYRTRSSRDNTRPLG
jgi:hypothetical protein